MLHPPPPHTFLNILGVIAGIAFYLIGVRFISGRIPTGNWLFYAYFIYAIATVILLHAIFFSLNRRLHASKKRKLVPKYLEYAYAIIISVGLAQVFFSAPRIATYVQYVAGEKEELIQKIVSVSRRNLQNECTRKQPSRYTTEYCNKLQQIAGSDLPYEHITNNVLEDRAFLDHIIGYTHTWGGGYPEYSPIATYAEQLRALIQYEQTPRSEFGQNVFAWLALLLLPIGIALRLVKTSLEVFGRLDENISRGRRSKSERLAYESLLKQSSESKAS